MNNFGTYLTPQEAYDHRHEDDERTLEELIEMANAAPELCMVCEVEDVWKYADCGMCFSCTTGEADASDDCELIGGHRAGNR